MNRDARAAVGGPARNGCAFARELRLRRDGGDAAAQRDPRRVRVRGGAASPELLGPESRDAPLTCPCRSPYAAASGTEPPRSAKSAERSGKSVERVERRDAADGRDLVAADPHSSLVSRWTLDALAELLDETLLFIGAFALLCPANQDMLRWGHAPTLAQRLPDLPERLQRRRGVGRPLPDARRRRGRTHSSSSESSRPPPAAWRRRLSGVEQEHLARQLNHGSVAEDDVGSRDPKQKNARSRVILHGGGGVAARFDFVARFPPELWEDAATYFSSSDA